MDDILRRAHAHYVREYDKLIVREAKAGSAAECDAIGRSLDRINRIYSEAREDFVQRELRRRLTIGEFDFLVNAEPDARADSINNDETTRDNPAIG